MKKTLSIVLALLLVLMAPAVRAEEARGWNIMLVIDGSNSLVSQTGYASDVNGLRYEAINALLDVLKNGGHSVGAVVFSAEGTDASGAHQEAILCNTGLLALDAGDTQNDLKTEIPKHMSRLTRNGTDIGAALLCAQKELAKADDGRPSAIFLFTDGANEVDPANVSQSEASRKAAIQGIRAAGTEFFGVYLDRGGLRMEDVKNIVTEVYPELAGQSAEALETSGHYMRLETADQIAASTDQFLAIIGKQVEQQETVTESFERSFQIPGAGINAVDLRFQTPGGEDLDPALQVTITGPDGAVYANLTPSTGRTYRVYRLEKPMAGQWTVRAEYPEGSASAVNFVPIFDIEIGAVLRTEPQELAVNKTAVITALLTSGGQALEDPAAYLGYECIITVTEEATGAVREYPIPAGGVPSMELPLERYGAYQVRAEFRCGEITAQAEAGWDLTNTPPVANGTAQGKYTVIRFLEEETVLDVGGFLSDREDKALQLVPDPALSSANVGAVTVLGHTLRFKPSEAGSGSLFLHVYDSQGAETTLTVELQVTDLTMVILGAAVAVVLLLVALVAVKLLRKTKRQADAMPDGTIALTVEVNNGILNLTLNAPGTHGNPRSMTLQELLEGDLARGSESALEEACQAFNRKYQEPDEDGIILVEPITARGLLDQHGAAFAKIKLTVTAETDPDKVVRAKIRVEGDGMAATLYGSSKRLPLDHSSDVTVTYLPGGE